MFGRLSYLVISIRLSIIIKLILVLVLWMLKIHVRIFYLKLIFFQKKNWILFMAYQLFIKYIVLRFWVERRMSISSWSSTIDISNCLMDALAYNSAEKYVRFFKIVHFSDTKLKCILPDRISFIPRDISRGNAIDKWVIASLHLLYFGPFHRTFSNAINKNRMNR